VSEPIPAVARRVLLVNLGTPKAPEPVAVRDFLAEFLADPMVVDYPAWFWKPILNGMILRWRPAKVAEMYRTIWTEHGSPLAAGTRRMAEGLKRLLPAAEVAHAYRYGHPSLVEGIEAAAAGGEDLDVVPLFPQRTMSTTGTIDRLTRRTAETLGLAGRVRVRAIEPDDAGYIEALGRRWDAALAEAGFEPDHLVVSFHGIPRRHDRKEGGRYHEDCERTTRALLARVRWPQDRTTHAYQSRFGPEPWLDPSTAGVLAELPARGVRSVAVVTPGFLTEGLETIEEIGMRGRATFLSAGGERFMRVRCVEDESGLLASIANAVGGE